MTNKVPGSGTRFTLHCAKSIDSLIVLCFYDEAVCKKSWHKNEQPHVGYIERPMIRKNR